MRKRVAAISGLLLSLFTTQASAVDAGSGNYWRGVFEPRAEAVIPAEISGRVVSIPKEPGDFCREGDPLVEFDRTIPTAAVQAVEAKLRAVHANHTATHSLFQKNQATAVDVARVETELAQVKLEMASAEREAKACQVLAPFSGKIVERRVRRFEWANRGSPLLLLVDDAILKVRFFLPENNFANIRVGDSVRVRVPATSGKVGGVVSRLGVVFDPVSRTFDVWADVDNAADILRAGMTAEVEWPVLEGGP